MDIGTAIKTIRKQKKLGQKDLSDATGLSVNSISQIELNATFPQKKNIAKICEALDIPVSYLLFFSITEEDVPEDKRATFSYLNGAVKEVLLDSIEKD